MKKIHLFILAIFMSFGLFSQTSEILLTDFESESLANFWAADATTIEIVDNPSATEPNTSAKVLKWTKTASTDRQVHYNFSQPHDLAVQDLRGVSFQVYNGGDATLMDEYFVDIRYSGAEPGPERWIILANNTPVTLMAGWNTITFDVDEIISDRFIQVMRIYPNKTTAVASTMYFDNIMINMKEEEEPMDVEGVSISQSSVNLVVDQTIQLAATVHPDNAENKNVAWASSNESVATVVDGLVTAVATGTATITVSTEAGNFSKVCEITVTDDLSSIKHIIGDYEGVVPSYWANGSGSVVNNPEQTPANESAIVYRYSKPDGAWKQYLIHTASNNIPRSALKSVSFQVYHGGDATEMTSYMLKVNTQNHEENADVDWQVELTLEPGWNTLTYLVAARDWSDRIASIEVYPLMESNDSGIFYFDNFILKTSEAAVAVASVELNHTTLDLNIGEEELLIATLLPENAANQNVTWSSSDERVATVDFWGMITAIGSGTATITVTTEDGDLTATCVVTVIDPTNVERLVSTDFKVFPNPYREGPLEIQFGDNFKGEQIITIYSLTGVLLESYKPAIDANKIIVTPQFGPGLYLILIGSSFHSASRILIVK